MDEQIGKTVWQGRIGDAPLRVDMLPSGRIAATCGRPRIVRTSTPPAENSRCTVRFYQSALASLECRAYNALGTHEGRVPGTVTKSNQEAMYEPEAAW